MSPGVDKSLRTGLIESGSLNCKYLTTIAKKENQLLKANVGQQTEQKGIKALIARKKNQLRLRLLQALENITALCGQTGR